MPLNTTEGYQIRQVPINAGRFININIKHNNDIIQIQQKTITAL